MKMAAALVFALMVTVFAAGTALSQAKPGPGEMQKTCFIMKGNPVNPRIYTDYQGYRIYFCCTHCRNEFARDPEKWFRAMVEAKVPLEKAPEK